MEIELVEEVAPESGSSYLQSARTHGSVLFSVQLEDQSLNIKEQDVTLGV